jgi:hypothetical protein
VHSAHVPVISCIILSLLLLNVVVVVRLFIHLCSSFVRLLLSFDSFALFIIHCSLFMRKIFNSDPGLYSRYLDPVVQDVPVAITIDASQ